MHFRQLLTLPALGYRLADNVYGLLYVYPP